MRQQQTSLTPQDWGNKRTVGKAIQTDTSQPPIQQLKADQIVTFFIQIKREPFCNIRRDELEAQPTANTKRSNSSFPTWSETASFSREIQRQTGKTEGPSQSKWLSLGQDNLPPTRNVGTGKNVGVGGTRRRNLEILRKKLSTGKSPMLPQEALARISGSPATSDKSSWP